MNLTELNSTVMGLWPKCDWTPDEWGLLADTVKRLPADQADTMLREVRRTQRSSRNPDMQDITKRVRSMTNAPAAGPSRQGGSKWDAQRAVWGNHAMTDYEAFTRYWSWMRSKHNGPADSFARMWHGYCAIDARDLGMCWNDAEREAAELTGGTPRPMPIPHGDLDDLMDALVNTTTPKGQRRVNVADRRREVRRMNVVAQLEEINGRPTP